MCLCGIVSLCFRTDYSGGGYLPVGIITTNPPDDDCLSYSSTEHELSMHDESRSHQLVPVSFSMSTGELSCPQPRTETFSVVLYYVRWVGG